MKKQCFGEWGVIVRYSNRNVETAIYWYKTKKEALIEYRSRKKETMLTFLVRQVVI